MAEIQFDGIQGLREAEENAVWGDSVTKAGWHEKIRPTKKTGFVVRFNGKHEITDEDRLAGVSVKTRTVDKSGLFLANPRVTYSIYFMPLVKAGRVLINDDLRSYLYRAKEGGDKVILRIEYDDADGEENGGIPRQVYDFQTNVIKAPGVFSCLGFDPRKVVFEVLSDEE